MKEIFEKWKPEGYELSLRRKKGYSVLELPKGYSYREGGMNEFTKGDERNFLRLYGGVDGRRLKRLGEVIGEGNDFRFLWVKITDEHIGFILLVYEKDGICRMEWPNIVSRWNRGGAFEALLSEGVSRLRKDKMKKLRIRVPSEGDLRLWRKIAGEMQK